MSRQFKVGDIVDAKSLINEAIEKPINQIGRLYIMVDFVWFRPEEVTLVQPFTRKPYKDQFRPWVPFKDVTNCEFEPDNENEKIMMLNILILLMTKEKQS